MTTGHRIALISDTTCDIPRDLIAQYDILLVPQYVIWGNRAYNDLTEIDAPTFYERLSRDPLHPTTSRPTVPDYLTLVEQAKANGAEEVVVILVSEPLSGSVPSARLAKQEVDIPFHIVDSMSVSMGLGFQVLAAARARQQGASAQQMIDAAAHVRRRLRVMFTVDTLEFLRRGGRIGGAAALLGTALQIKPSLYVDHTTGTIQPGEKVRTRRKALAAIYDAVLGDVTPTDRLHVAVVHGAAPEEAEEMAQRIQAEHNPAELIVTHISPAIGVHAGPGVLGIGLYTEG